MDERQRQLITRMVQTLPRILFGLLLIVLVVLALVLAGCTFIVVRAPVTNSDISVTPTVSVVAHREQDERKSVAERLREKRAGKPPE